MNHLELKHLRMISIIAKTQNMTRAAERLFVSQSALSQQLKDIEGKLGANLFNRTRKRMLLTAIGKRILKTAEHVIETIEDTELEIAKIVSGDTGELRVGTQCIFCYKWLPLVMGAFQKKFPNIEIIIGDSNSLFEELESGKYDFVISGGTVDDDRFTHLPLFEDQMSCIMPNNHPLTAKQFFDFDNIIDASLIAHMEKEDNRFFQHFIKPRGIEPPRYMTVRQPQAIIELVSSGFGIGFFPKWAVKSAIESKALTARPITRTGIPIQWNAVFLKKRRLEVFQREFINMLGKLNPVERREKQMLTSSGLSSPVSSTR